MKFHELVVELNHIKCEKKLLCEEAKNFLDKNELDKALKHIERMIVVKEEIKKIENFDIEI